MPAYGATTTAIVPGHVGMPNATSNRYYVNELIFVTSTSMELDQKAWYLEDRWQVSDNLLLSSVSVTTSSPTSTTSARSTSMRRTSGRRVWASPGT